MARYQYEAAAPQRALQDYMAMITGQYGSTSAGSGSTTQTGVQQPNQMLPVLGNIAAAAIMGSDIHIKENIVPEGSKWKGLNVYTYNYIGGIYPDAVVTINGIKHVKYGDI
jgi:hypothetical protein